MKTNLTLFVTVLAAALFWGGCSSLNKGLVAYYPFNGDARDKSWNWNHGEVKGATLAEDRHGKADSAYSFDGVDDYIDLPVIEFNVFNSFTVSLWFKPNGTAIRRQRLVDFLAKRQDGMSAGIHYNRSSDGRVSYGVFGQRVIGKKELAVNKYNHIIISHDSSADEVAIYIDGELENASEIIDLIVPATRVRIGARMEADSVFRKTNGSIDDVRIYNRALSANEVKALYDLEKPKGK